MATRSVVVLGSTGSIGTQTLDVVRRAGPDRARIVGLAAGANADLLDRQVRETGCRHSALVSRDGASRLVDLATLPEANTVVVAVNGAAGLEAVVAACKAGKRICIATKEVLVAAGDLVVDLARRHGATLLPVDSEHSAIFQCLAGYDAADVRALHLTASGGPFRTWNRERIACATREEALDHPTWRMGGKITIDSASLMNKGLEVIEACRLFGFDERDVHVVVHPQSIIHSFVEFNDGALLAQLGLPDMRLPIQVALFHPEKPDLEVPRIEPTRMADLTFEPPDVEKFPCLRLAREAVRAGGTMPAVLNAANEEAVAAFLAGEVPFGTIPAWVEDAMANIESAPADTLEVVLEADTAARRHIARLRNRNRVEGVDRII
ncbi:MAG: 1-deoxy-D-xylulose-5-phosphate reductoisomerase [Armatimonadota bacterium]